MHAGQMKPWRTSPRVMLCTSRLQLRQPHVSSALVGATVEWKEGEERGGVSELRVTFERSEQVGRSLMGTPLSSVLRVDSKRFEQR